MQGTISHPTLALQCTKAYLMNYSEFHADGCTDVYCPRTKRVRKSVDVKFLDTSPIDDEEAPDMVDFSLSPVAPTPTTTKPPGYIIDTLFPNHSVSASIPSTELRDGDTLRLGDISKCQTAHTRERCVQLHNKTVAQALKTLVTHSSGASAYPKRKDIQYSVLKGNMTAHRTHSVPTPSVYTGHVEQANQNDRYDPPRTTRIEHIDEDMGRDIATIVRPLHQQARVRIPARCGRRRRNVRVQTATPTACLRRDSATSHTREFGCCVATRIRKAATQRKVQRHGGGSVQRVQWFQRQVCLAMCPVPSGRNPTRLHATD